MTVSSISPDHAGVVVVGGGHAGVEAALSLREEGYTDPVTILSKDREQPYERPPLSKGWLKGEVAFDQMALRAQIAYESNDVTVRTDCTVQHVDRGQRSVVCDDGTEVPYDHLVLALGASPRALPIPGSDLRGVHHLHTYRDARDLRAHLDTATSVAVVGGGFIGLEVAAAARVRGVPVRVLEAGERVMQRAVTPSISAFYEWLHQEAGTEVSREALATALVGEKGHVRAVRLHTGELLAADLVVIGVGVTPNTTLADDAGLDVDNGIMVDEMLRSSDADISAIGDCARFPAPHGDGRLRLESVQNAVDQARTVAARIAGRPVAYQPIPWFWTDQLGCKLQMVGLTADSDEHVVVGDIAARKFTVLCWKDGVLVGGESVNRPGDHITLRRLLDRDAVELAPQQAAQPDFTLKSYLKSLEAVPIAS